MPDIAALIQAGATNAWLYLPVAILLGSLHALEPGHSKAVIAAFVIAIRGTAAQAALLGLSAAVGHTIIVWGLALVGLTLGDAMISARMEPWLILLSGLLLIVMAVRLIRLSLPEQERDHHGHHDHDHHHGHSHTSEGDIRHQYAGRTVSTKEIIWFGFSSGLLPCPAAIAVLLVSLQAKQFALGVTMVAAFSLGLALSMVAVGIAAAWGARIASTSGKFDRLARIAPQISGWIVLLVGIGMALQGLKSLGYI